MHALGVKHERAYTQNIHGSCSSQILSQTIKMGAMKQVALVLKVCCCALVADIRTDNTMSDEGMC